MPKVNTSLRSFRDRLRKVLKEELASGGIAAIITTEAVPYTKLLRVMVKAKNFRDMRPSERQDFVWRIVDKHFSVDEQLRISMILTLTPDELAGK